MGPFKTLPPRHSLVPTEDGSYTLFSEAFQEACHSTSGAQSETMLHYIQGCQVLTQIKKHSPFTILEVGFGLGIGFLSTFEKLGAEASWHFISLEIDRDLLEWFRLAHQDHPLLRRLEWKQEDGPSFLEAKDGRVGLTILQGDARHTLPAYVAKRPVTWNAIYQDAFSPRRNPVLWTKEWFRFLKEHAHSEAILSTYSASTSIRKSLHEAGWGVHQGDKFGPKRTSTRASLVAPTDPEILLHMERSPVHALSDDKLEDFLTK